MPRKKRRSGSGKNSESTSLYKEHPVYEIKDGLLRSRADLVLDPMCGSGTCCHAAYQLGRRFLGIDGSGQAIGVTDKRLRDAGSRDHEVVVWPASPDDWDDGKNRLVLGDTLEVLRGLPDSFCNLVYLDPPFGPSEGAPDKKYFGIEWKWTEKSDQALERIRNGPGHKFRSEEWREAIVMQVEFLKRFQPDMGAYIVWMSEILIEVRRVSGSRVVSHDPGPRIWRPTFDPGLRSMGSIGTK